jgi:hypothetical protein
MRNKQDYNVDYWKRLQKSINLLTCLAFKRAVQEKTSSFDYREAVADIRMIDKMLVHKLARAYNIKKYTDPLEAEILYLRERLKDVEGKLENQERAQKIVSGIVALQKLLKEDLS